MVFPPTPLSFHALATSTYINNAFSDAGTRFTNVETTANNNAASIAAATSSTTAGSLVKWDASTGGITPPASSLSVNTIIEFGAYASSPISTVVHYTGGYYLDKTVSSATTPRFLANGTTSHAAPASGQGRFDCVSFTISTGAVNVQPGVAAAIGSAGLPAPANAGDQVMYFAYTQFGMAGIKNTSDGTNGYIIPVSRANFGASGSGGGGTPLTNAVAGIGTGTPTNIIPIFRGDASLGTVNSVNLDATDPNGSGLPTNKGWGILRSDGANSGSLADALRNFIPADIQSRIYASGATAHLSASPLSECCIVYNGRARTNVADVAATATGGFGTRWLWADLSGSPGFTIYFTSSSSPLTSWSVLLATFYWDNATLHTDANAAPDFTPIATVGSHQVTPNLLILPASGASTTADAMTGSGWMAQTVLNGMTGTFVFPKSCHVQSLLYILYSGVGVPGTYAATFRMTVDGVAIANGDQYVQTTNGLADTLCVPLPTIPIAAGAHTIAVAGFISNAAASFSTFANDKYLEMRVMN